MQFKQVDIYTESEAVQILTMRLSELGFNGFIISHCLYPEDAESIRAAGADFIDSE